MRPPISNEPPVFKDAAPMDTVQRIRGILKEHAIETQETWFPSDVPHCYALRVSIAGSCFGANGKGVNEAFTLASGYGELIERLQLGHVWRDKLSPQGGTASCEAQSRPVPLDQLLAQNPRWYDRYSQSLLHATGVSMTGRQILAQFADSDNNVMATPFYCVTGQKQEFLPSLLCKNLYMTNGGAAGNTPEEAIVQAISEIVERHYKLEILSTEPALPEIPEAVLRTFPVIWEIIDHLRQAGYRITVKDCSLGAKFPVVSVCLVSTKTGRYHTHFGAHPKLEVALERILTESFQGRTLRDIAKHEDFSFLASDAFHLQHLGDELVYGTSEKSPKFFTNATQQPWNAGMGFSGQSNRELLKECIEFFRQQDLDVLVRDCSCLGFPTYQVVIPGYSEVFPNRLSRTHDDLRYSPYAIRALRNPTTASMEDMLGLMMHVTKRSYAVLNSFTYEAGLPALLSRQEEDRLMQLAMAHISYTLRRHKDTIRYLDLLLRLDDDDNTEYLLCLKRWLSLKQHGYSEDEIRQTLLCLHNPVTVTCLLDRITEKANPLDFLVLRCDDRCGNDCPLLGRCFKKHTEEIADLIRRNSRCLDQTPIIRQLRDL